MKKSSSRPSAWSSSCRRLGLMAAVGFDFGLAATCCLNSTSGQPFDSCTCLADNSQTSGQTVSRGESAMYHWVLEDSNAELITTSQRGNLTFKVRHMLYGPVTPFRTRLPFSRQVFSKIGVGFSPRKVQRRLSIRMEFRPCVCTDIYASVHGYPRATVHRASTSNRRCSRTTPRRHDRGAARGAAQASAPRPM